MSGNRTGKTEQSLSLLRALLANRQVPDANRISITVGELRALAAAEAAPLDVFTHDGCNTCQIEPGRYVRLPDTEAAPLKYTDWTSGEPVEKEWVVCPVCHEPEHAEDMVTGVCLSCADAITWGQNARRGAVTVEVADD